MAKPILVTRVSNQCDRKRINEIDKLLQEKTHNEYCCMVVADQEKESPVFEVYNAEQLTPIQVEELKAILNLK